jgi:hypothetical protein
MSRIRVHSHCTQRIANSLRTRFIGRRALAVLSMIFATTAMTAVADTKGPSLMEVARAFGFDEAQVASLRAGEIVSGELEANSDNELALSMAFLSSHDLSWHWDRMIDTARSDPSIRAIGELIGDGKAALEEFSLPAEDLDQLAKVEAGPKTNFSIDEIARLQAAAATSRDPEPRRAALLSTMREILAARFAAYRNGGLDAIAPYARSDGDESFPARQLERAFTALQVTKLLVPDAWAAMANFPTKPPESVENKFYWMTHEAQDHVVVALIHAVSGRENDRLAVIERRFYVSQSLNSLQAVAVALPIEEGTAVFYANRTGTDQVTGFGSSIAKGVGRTIMRRELERTVKAFLKMADQED